MQETTKLVLAGRHPERFFGMVNTPIFRGSTILSDSIAEWEQKKKDQSSDHMRVSSYGRFGTPTQHSLEEALAEIEGGYRSLLFPSGLAAASVALTALLSAGDHVLVTDNAYSPTRGFLTRVLSRYGVEVTRYAPTIGAGIEAYMKPNTRVVYVESPGSDTFEIQDVPAIAGVAHRHDAAVIMDNTWASPLFFKPFEHGVDVSIQAATKYIVGHSDAMLGVVTCTRAMWPNIKQATFDFGQTAGPDDAYLALRGLRTMGVRLRQHWQAGLQLAAWLETRPEVEAVLHPALPSHPGHELWRRDFLGASGLFSVVLKPVSREAADAFVNSLSLFGLGLSWGGYESLLVPFNPSGDRVASPWKYAGPAFRLHVGLEDPRDLIADLEHGFAVLGKIGESACQVAG